MLDMDITAKAGKAMVHRERMTTFITVTRKIRKGASIMEIEGEFYLHDV